MEGLWQQKAKLPHPLVGLVGMAVLLLSLKLPSVGAAARNFLGLHWALKGTELTQVPPPPRYLYRPLDSISPIKSLSNPACFTPFLYCTTPSLDACLHLLLLHWGVHWTRSHNINSGSLLWLTDGVFLGKSIDISEPQLPSLDTELWWESNKIPTISVKFFAS